MVCSTKRCLFLHIATQSDNELQSEIGDSMRSAFLLDMKITHHHHDHKKNSEPTIRWVFVSDCFSDFVLDINN